MAVVTLTGLIDPNVFVPGYTPTGTDVGTEIATVLTKGNETIVLANANEIKADANAAAIIVTDAAVAAIDVRTTALEGSAGNAYLAIGDGPTVLTHEQCEDYEFIIALPTSDGNLTLPLPTDIETVLPHPVTILNSAASQAMSIQIAAFTVWSNNGIGAIALASGESVTLYPMPYAGAVAARWAPIAGKSVADIA